MTRLSKDKLIEFLRYIEADCPNDEPFNDEPIEGQEIDGVCPDHLNCGICRYEYMKQKGWLSSVLTQPEGGEKKWVDAIVLKKQPLTKPPSG